MSFGFKTRKERAATEQDDIDFSTAEPGMTHADVRVITEVELFELTTLPWTFASQPMADVANVRSVAVNNAYSTTLESIRAGELTDAQIDELVAARQARAGAGLSTPLPEEAQAPTFDLLFAVAQSRARLILES
jgi:hypothetical protein